MLDMVRCSFSERSQSEWYKAAGMRKLILSELPDCFLRLPACVAFMSAIVHQVLDVSIDVGEPSSTT